MYNTCVVHVHVIDYTHIHVHMYNFKYANTVHVHVHLHRWYTHCVPSMKVPNGKVSSNWTARMYTHIGSERASHVEGCMCIDNVYYVWHITTQA